MFAWGPITVEGRTPPAGEEFINADMRMIGGDYFRVMEIPLIKGRVFDDHDTDQSQRVTVIDERMARDLWPGEDANRQAHPPWWPQCHVAVDHRRGHCRQHQAVHARHRLAHRALSHRYAVSAPRHERRRAQSDIAGAVDDRRPRCGPPARFHAADLQRP
jgi:hypothetical protein